MSLRRMSGCLTVCGLLASTAASAAPASCLSEAQQSAFDVGALKSALSVVAVACGQEDSYNQFVEKHRRELVAEDATVNGFFKRVYGRVAQARYDSYITLLANEQGEIGQREGSDYCPRFTTLFSEVMAVPSAVLPEYAAGKDLMPGDLTPCAASAAPQSHPSPTKRAVHRK